MDIPTLFRKAYIFRRGGMARHKTAGTWTEQKDPRRLFIRCPACHQILDVTQYDFMDAGNDQYAVKYARSCSHCFCGHVFNFALLGYGKRDPDVDRVISLARKEMAKVDDHCGRAFYILINMSNGIITNVNITAIYSGHMASIYRTQPGGHYMLGATGLRAGIKFTTIESAIESAALALMGKLK